MALRIDCTIVGHTDEWVEYRPIRYKDRLRFQEAMGERPIWEAVRDCIVAWKLTDMDGKELPQPTGLMKAEELGELQEAMYSWLIGSFWEAILVGRRQAQAPPSSEQSD